MTFRFLIKSKQQLTLQILRVVLLSLFAPLAFAGIHEAYSPDTTLDSYPKLIANGAEIDSATRIGDQAVVQLVNRFPNGQILYSLDGSEPSLNSTPYTVPFTITRSSVVRQFFLNEDFTETGTVEAVSLQIVPTFPLSTPVTGSGQVVRTPSTARYLQDEVVGVKAVPADGWRFARWEVDLSGAFPDRNVAMSRDKTVRAIFEMIPIYALKFTSQGGSIYRNADQTGGIKVGGLIAGHWDFDKGNLLATLGKDLEYLDGTNGLAASGTKFGLASDFGLPALPGGDARVMRVPGDLSNKIGYIVNHGIAPNGGGTRVNQYSLLMDILIAPYGSGATGLWEVSSPDTNTSDADLFWQGNHFGQGGGGYNGTGAFTAGTWHRVVAAYDMAADPPVVRKYVDGQLEDNWTANQALDHPRRSLGPTGLLFADGDQDERREIWVNSIQIRAGAMSNDQVQALGAATSSGIPVNDYVLSGSILNISAKPDVGWIFLGWNGDHFGSKTNLEWVVTGPATFEAQFGTSISKVATGSGQIVLEPELAVYPYGTEVRVIPAPNAGFALALWGGVGTGQPKSEWILKVTNATPKITALFQSLATDKAVLTAQSTLGGRVTQAAVDGIYAKGTSVVLTPVAEVGYEFTNWSGDASGSDNPLTVVLDSSKTVKAGFRKVGVASYPVTVAIAGPGKVRRVPDLGAYEAGSEVELVAETTGSALFAGWTGAVSSSQKRVRISVNGPMSATATFKAVYPVATEVRGEGQILLSPPDLSYPDGTVVALTAKPADGWGFVQWSGDIATTIQEAGVTVDAPKRVIAEFARLGTLTTKVLGSGTVSRTPEGQSFLPGTAVTLTAQAQAGWRFLRWSGGASGTNATTSVVVGRTEAIVAEFTDGEPPVLTVTQPVSGAVEDQRFSLSGTASDAVSLRGVRWTWNGVSQGDLPLSAGGFSVGNLNLYMGTNFIEVTAEDTAGNVSVVRREVVWKPIRTLIAGSAVEVQEGQRIVFSISMVSTGDVGGLTFKLNYNPAFLTDPKVEWSAVVGQSVNTVNTSVAGEISGSFSLPGTALASGTAALGTVNFRARSVPVQTNAILSPAIVSVANSSGTLLATGNGAIAGEGRIRPRKIKGDNNANQRIDIGDAVVISRLLVSLEETRSWDVGLNDLNGSLSLDNGDVIKALRTVVGLDPQPSPGSEGKRLAMALGFAKVLVNTNDAVTIELLDGPKATVGQPYRVAVRLNRVKGDLSGLSFALKYPASLNLTDKQVGVMVPGDALPFWNESAGQVSLAAIRSTAWANATGVAAVLTFVPSAGYSAQAEWPLKLEQVEITGSGFDVRPVDPVAVAIQSGGGTVNTPPQISLQPPKTDGSMTLEILAPQGTTVAVETTSDLNTWVETQQVTGLGTSTPVKVTLQADPNVQAKFWRVRVR